MTKWDTWHDKRNDVILNVFRCPRCQARKLVPVRLADAGNRCDASE